MSTFADEVTAEVEAARKAAASQTDDTQGDAGNGDQGVSSGDGGGDSQSTGEQDGAPPGTGSTIATAQDKTVPISALEDEREKRQLERQLREGLERRIAELEASIKQAKPTEPETPEVDYDKIFEDPRSVLEAHTKAVLSKSSGDKMHQSREMARAQLPDYDETIAKLQKFSVPGIQEAVAKSPAPAFTAYRLIKDFEKQQQQQSAGSEKVTELEKKLAEATAQIEALRTGNAPNLPSLSQSRGANPGTQQPVKTVDSVLDAVWGKSLRKR